MFKKLIIQLLEIMKKLTLITVALLLFSITFSQTKLSLDINGLRNPDVKCYLIVILEQKDARFPFYEYLIINDTINDIVYLNGADKKINLPFDGEITSENVKIEYTLRINEILNKGILNEKFIMNVENYFTLRIKENKIIIESTKQ